MLARVTQAKVENYSASKELWPLFTFVVHLSQYMCVCVTNALGQPYNLNITSGWAGWRNGKGGDEYGPPMNVNVKTEWITINHQLGNLSLCVVYTLHLIDNLPHFFYMIWIANLSILFVPIFLIVFFSSLQCYCVCSFLCWLVSISFAVFGELCHGHWIHWNGSVA